jgi:hypothetical protein
MYYYLYRFYDPSLQRWMNRDPLGEIGFEINRRLVPLPLIRFVPIAEMSQGPNLYTYVHNDPEDKYDSLGLGMPGFVPPHGPPQCFMKPMKPGAPCWVAFIQISTMTGATLLPFPILDIIVQDGVWTVAILVCG